MPTVVVLAPMRTELTPVVRRLALRRDRARAGGPQTWTGRCGEHDVVATVAGVGTRRAGEVARTMIELVAPDHVVVVGVAGGLAASLGIAAVVVPARVRSLDDGAVHLAHRLGDREPHGELLTSRLLHGWAELEAEAEAGALAIDMETAAVAAVAAERGVPWTAIRALSDLVRDGTVDGSTLDLVREDGSTHLAGVARHLARHPGAVAGLAAMGRDATRATRAAAAALHEALACPPSGPVGRLYG